MVGFGIVGGCLVQEYTQLITSSGLWKKDISRVVVLRASIISGKHGRWADNGRIFNLPGK
jgi:hypothetical protein